MLNILRDSVGARKKYKRLGRGIGSGKGKTCARGGKGQTARSGVAIKHFEGGQMPMYMRLPKRGFTNINKTKYEIITLPTIVNLLNNKSLPSTITLEVLKERGLCKGIGSQVKLIGGNAEVKSPFTIQVHAASKSVVEALKNVKCEVELV